MLRTASDLKRYIMEVRSHRVISCTLSAHIVVGVLFGIVSIVIAGVTLGRLRQRNVIRDATVEPGPLGGAFYDEDTRDERRDHLLRSR